ncbi:uncharacterized protein LOC115732564 isoform X3 [Rhodamnia argentea]|nr:uncharacterized protein LOC115732564 isoform X3 [Rhodamnia argentea]XP_030519086.2 uncharacterized protein LOC115732564 isoform X3 [Rhodamnia argentea]
MDADLHVLAEELPPSTENGNLADVLSRENLIPPAVCALCHTNSVANGDQEPSNICGDCKIEYFENPIRESRDRFRRGSRISRGRSRYSSSESTESRFSRHFSQMINLIRQNQSTAYMHEDNFSDGESSARLLQQTSTYTTPSGSRRWRHVASDAESDGFDNMDSTYGESDTTVGLGRLMVFHGESDGVSFSAYGWDSDASIDGRNSMIDAEVFFQPDETSNPDSNSDTDIDPMNAGLNHWNLDDEEEDGGDGEEDYAEEDEWEETDAEEDITESAEGHGQIQNAVISSPAEGSDPPDWSHLIVFPQEGMIRWRIRQSRQIVLRDVITDVDESQLPSDVGHSGDYLDTRSFEELLEYLADNENSRRGAPPAAVSFVNSLPLIVIDEDTPKNDDSACAICKDVLTVGTEANQLPCRHLYHPSCILPWLNTRNSCPLCRYELPTDDRDYEEAKQNISRSRQIDDSSSWRGVIDNNSSDGAEADEELELDQSIIEQGDTSDGYPRVDGSRGEAGRGRWLALAAAPIISLVGVALVLWLGNPLAQGRRATNYRNFSDGHLGQVPAFGASASNRSGRANRRWWFPF